MLTTVVVVGLVETLAVIEVLTTVLVVVVSIEVVVTDTLDEVTEALEGSVVVVLADIEMFDTGVEVLSFNNSPMSVTSVPVDKVSAIDTVAVDCEYVS